MCNTTRTHPLLACFLFLVYQIKTKSLARIQFVATKRESIGHLSSLIITPEEDLQNQHRQLIA